MHGLELGLPLIDSDRGQKDPYIILLINSLPVAAETAGSGRPRSAAAAVSGLSGRGHYVFIITINNYIYPKYWEDYKILE